MWRKYCRVRTILLRVVNFRYSSSRNREGNLPFVDLSDPYLIIDKQPKECIDMHWQSLLDNIIPNKWTNFRKLFDLCNEMSIMNIINCFVTVIYLCQHIYELYIIKFQYITLKTLTYRLNSILLWFPSCLLAVFVI